MSVAVDVAALSDQLDRFGPSAFLISVSDDGLPHVVSVSAALDGDRLTCRVGRHTSANLAARPDLTLLWPAEAGAAYSLLVDARAEGALAPGGGPIRMAPAKAVLHRVAGAPGDGPTCLPVG